MINSASQFPLANYFIILYKKMMQVIKPASEDITIKYYSTATFDIGKIIFPFLYSKKYNMPL